MLAEFLREVVGLGRSTVKVEFHRDEELPGVVFVQHGDRLERLDAPPPERCARLIGMDDLVAALKDSAIAPNPEVYVGPHAVIALLDREDRRQRIAVELTDSQRWRTVVELQKPTTMQPKAAVKMLRFDLHGGNVAHIIQQLSRIDFVRTSTGKSHVEHGRESLGRSVEAAVQQADKVDDQFLLAVPVWSTPGFSRFTVQVQFGIYLDLEAQAVELRVLADEVERARSLALAAAHAELQARLANVPVFLGAP